MRPTGSPGVARFALSPGFPERLKADHVDLLGADRVCSLRGDEEFEVAAADAGFALASGRMHRPLAQARGPRAQKLLIAVELAVELEAEAVKELVIDGVKAATPQLVLCRSSPRPHRESVLE